MRERFRGRRQDTHSGAGLHLIDAETVDVGAIRGEVSALESRAVERVQAAAALLDPALHDVWFLYCEAIARLRKAMAACGHPARAEAQLRLALPRLMRWLEQDWDAERRLLALAPRREFDRVLVDCLRARPARRRAGSRRRSEFRNARVRR